MHKLKSITPLGAVENWQDSIGHLTIQEVTDQALASVAARRSQEENLIESFHEHFSFSLPTVGRVAGAHSISALWIGQGQWMICAPYSNHQNLAAELKSVFTSKASVVEQTDGWCRFDVSGTGLCDLFERLCNVPVLQMQVHDVVRTTIEHLGVYLWRQAEDHMTIMAPRSSAGSLHHGLIAMARSIA